MKIDISTIALYCEADIDHEINCAAEVGEAIRGEITWTGMYVLGGQSYESRRLGYSVIDYLMSDRDYEKESIRDYLSKLSDSMEIVGAYPRIKFSAETIAKADRYLAEYKTALEEYRPIVRQRDAEREAEKAHLEELKAKFSVGKVYKDVKPRGGEYGTDGCFDADYINNTTGVVTRMVARDVFDFGCYSYPKRVEGTDDALTRENWTDEELAVNAWIRNFGKFKGIRM